MIVKAGVQMDSLIARKLWRVVVVNDAEIGKSYMVGQGDKKRVPLPPFSTDMDQASRVVDFLSTKGWTFRYRHDPKTDLFEAVFYRDGMDYTFVTGETVPMAICNAALYLLTKAKI
jgi:hypothetical protein